MPDSPDPAFGLDAMLQSLPTKPVTVWEIGWNALEPSAIYLQAFYDWCLARDREEAEAENAARDAADTLDQEPPCPLPAAPC